MTTPPRGKIGVAGRAPTTEQTALSWWRDALAGKAPQITGEPQCGYFRRKLVKGGPDVPARIWLHQELDVEALELIGDEELRCEVDGRAADAADQWMWLAGNPITLEEWKYMSARRAWAAHHEPNDAFAEPSQAIDWLTTRTPF